MGHKRGAITKGIKEYKKWKADPEMAIEDINFVRSRNRLGEVSLKRRRGIGPEEGMFEKAMRYTENRPELRKIVDLQAPPGLLWE